MAGKKGSGNRTNTRGKPPRVRRKISRQAAREIDTLAEEWDIDGDQLLSELVTRTPRNLFEVAAECIRDMGGAEKLKQKEDPPIIV